MSERKMREDGLGRAPDGSGSHLTDHAASRHGRPGFDPSRDPLTCFAQEMIRRAFMGEAMDGGDIQAWAVQYGLLREEAYSPAIHGPNDVDAKPGDPWYVMAGPLAARARDQRAEREDGASRPRPEAASPIGKAEAPINSTMLSALKAIDEALTDQWGSPEDMSQDGGHFHSAWLQIRSAISQANRG